MQWKAAAVDGVRFLIFQVLFHLIRSIVPYNERKKGIEEVYKKRTAISLNPRVRRKILISFAFAFILRQRIMLYGSADTKYGRFAEHNCKD